MIKANIRKVCSGRDQPQPPPEDMTKLPYDVSKLKHLIKKIKNDERNE